MLLRILSAPVGWAGRALAHRSSRKNALSLRSGGRASAGNAAARSQGQFEKSHTGRSDGRWRLRAAHYDPVAGLAHQSQHHKWIGQVQRRKSVRLMRGALLHHLPEPFFNAGFLGGEIEFVHA
jgi:hypothetical protein